MSWIRRFSKQSDGASVHTATTSASDTFSEPSSIHSHSTQPTTIDQPARRDSHHPELAGNERFYDGTLEAQEIRLLRIEPGSFNSPLACNLDNALLEKEPQYEAVSYCWGPQASFRAITVDGKSGFLITPHLHAALRRLRRQSEPRHVWIDAICINQANPQERSHQVDRMRSIFSKADHVVIWLGELSPRSSQRPTCKCHVPDGLHDVTQAVCAEPGLSAFEHGDMAKLIRDKLHADERRSRQPETLGQVWWKRLWVVQEFGVARQTPTVSVGPHTISWEFFSERLWSHGERHLFQDLRNAQESQTLRNLLLSTSNDFYCSEPRDWIYALLGLVDDENKPKPDYSKGVAEVYEEAMVYMIKTEKTVDVIFDDRTERAWCYPSWIPRFSHMREPHAIKTLDRFRAGYDTPVVDLVPRRARKVLCNCSSHNALRLNAIPFDNIKSVVDMGKMSRAASVLKHFLKQLDIDFQQPPRHLVDRAPHIGYLMLEFIFAGKLSVLQTFERAREELCGIAGVSWVPKMHYPEQLAKEFKFDYTRETTLDMAVATTFEDDFKRTLRSKDNGTRTFKNKLGVYTVPVGQQDRVFFSTESGYAGLGPGSLVVGDSVIVPFGSSRPFVVRGHSDHCVFIGDAVVPGIMSGQLVDLYKEGLIEDDVFDVK